MMTMKSVFTLCNCNYNHNNNNNNLEIWGKAQHESAQRHKSNWGENLGDWNSP